MEIPQNNDDRASGLHLLFASGKRPNRALIKAYAQEQHATSVTHDPLGDTSLQLVSDEGEALDRAAAATASQGSPVWVELLHTGLTFDLHGLMPGPLLNIADIDHRYDLAQSPRSMRLEPLTLVPGSHLAGGANSLPVVRGMIALTCEMIQHFEDLVAVIWPPARSVIGRRYFESVASEWLDGGAFPTPGLTSFKQTVDGALESVGLAFWTGQELRIEAPLSYDTAAATRLGERIINQLVMIGRLDQSDQFLAPDGTRLMMRPSHNGQFVRVSHD